jgi:alkylation response protein AidB-like acyl-CoA dehydrogenase
VKPYRAPLGDLRFVIEDALDAPAAWAALPAFANVDAATAAQVLEAAARFASDVLSPLNASGDREGCSRDGDGNVRTPAGFRAAYRLFVEGGWPALAIDADVGGQGLPLLLDVALQEMLTGANHGWTMYPGLLHGAGETLRAHGSAELKARYLPRLVSGEWLAVMALSEPDAGSDLGRVRTRATVLGDGSLRIDGTKIFISGGDHDLTDNIVHLVLCRRDGAPPGSKGLTLALVPKRLADGSRNGVVCDGIETKLGIHASATCTIRYDGATGWLVGEFERGLAAMFVMMNSARLRVGMQGLAHADAAGQRALEHALERRQSRAPRASGASAADADPIALHPAVRRKLLGVQAFVEGARLVACFTALRLDVAAHHPDEGERSRAGAEVALLTPTIKAFFTDEGFRRVSDALQVLGGYGYLADYGIEQTLRDSRIALLYEGTNEIQAIDLLVRKVLGGAEGARGFESLLARFDTEVDACDARPGLADFGTALRAQCDAARRSTAAVRDDAGGDRRWRIADDYLAAFGHLLLTWSWATAARASLALADRDFAERKLAVCRYGIDWIQDQGLLHWSRVQRGPALAALR